jgi:murein DD-endopeptidase MepM/ murein hydrolase activator NlpD
MIKPFRYFLAAILIVLLLVGIAIAVIHGMPKPQIMPPPSAKDLDRIDQLIRQKIGQHSDVMAFVMYDVKTENTRFSEDGTWALVSLAYVDRSNGSVIPTEPGTALAHRLAGDWQVTLQVDPAWESVLKEAPADLLAADAKALLAPPNPEEVKGVAKALSGYYLPWSAGQQELLSQSIGHGTGQSYYAYDFYNLTNRNWPIVASRTGTVKYAVWTYPNNYNDGNCNHANYIVLEDTSTTPTTYQVYLHLQYDSIPASLRSVGARVYRGQFLATADNTGCSSGSHLHFQVHTSTYSWFGTSVDITFSDVGINGGRPRTAGEASAYGGQGQTTYTSGNTSGTDFTPPNAGMTTPADHTAIGQTALHLSGWATDSGSGFSHAYFIANYGNGWEQVSPVFPTSPFSYDWDLCASGVPLGPVAISLRAYDRDGLPADGLPGLRNIVHTASCPVPPTPCTYTPDQVALFSETGFRGSCVVKGVGNYSDAALWSTLGDNAAMSIQVGANVRATAYSGTGYTGRTETFSAGDKSLADNPIGARNISALRVVPRSQAPEIPALVWPLPNATLTYGDTFLIHWRGGAGTELFGYDITGYPNQAAEALPYLKIEAYMPRLGSLPWYVHACNTYDPPLNNCSNEWGTGQWNVAAAPVWPAASGAPFVDHLEGDVSRWETTGLWRLGTGVGANATRAWVYNNGTNYDTGEPNGGFLTSPPIEILAAGYRLHFRSWNDTEPGTIHWDQRYVQIAQDGGPYRTLWRLTDEEARIWGESPAIDLSPYAGHTIRVRFTFTTLDDQNNDYGGWAIDDVSIDTETAPVCNVGNEPNDAPASATALSAGTTIAGQICPRGDADFYKINANAGDRVIVRLIGMTGLAPHLDILDADGASPLASADANSVGMVVAQSGSYYIKVRSRYHPAAGGADQGYSIQLQTDSDVPAVSFAYPAASGTYGGGGVVNIALTASDSGGVQKAVIYSHGPDWQSGNWSVLCEDSNGADGWSCPINTGGLTPGAAYAFFAIVTDWVGNQSAAAVWNVSFTGDAVAPTVALSPLPALSSATLIPLQWTGSDAQSGIDHFDVEVNSDGSGWNVWQSGLAAGSTHINYLGQLGHAYAFRVVAYDKAGNSARSEASTTIATCGADSLEPDDTILHASALSLGALQEHTFCGVGDVDWMSFSAVKGQTYLLQGIPTSPLATVWLTLFGSDGVTLLLDAPHAPDQFNIGASIYWRAPASGLYYVRAQHSYPAIAGPNISYRMVLSISYDAFLPVVMR